MPQLMPPGTLPERGRVLLNSLLELLRMGAIRPEMYGAIGDGVADDTAALSSFFAALQNGGIGVLTGVYRITSLISVALSDCEIRGIPGKTQITGAFGYAVMRLLALNNVEISGIAFNSQYVNTTEDLGSAVLYSYQSDAKNVVISRCTFTAPNANTSGLSFYTRINSADAGAVLDGLWIEDCDFISLGRIGCTLMNRGTGTDKYQAAQRVYFNRNRGKDMGLSGNSGFLLSLDGYGRAFTVNDNVILNALVLGIENTNWCSGSFRGNRFGDFQRTYAPMSFSNSGGIYMTDLDIEDNVCLEPASSRSNFIAVKNSRFSNNVFWTGTADYAFHMRDATGNTFSGDRFISGKTYAALIGNSSTTTKYNRWVNCRFDLSAGDTSSVVAVAFDGANTQRNFITGGYVLKGAGGTMARNQNGADGNIIERPQTDDTRPYPAARFVTLSDADYTPTDEIAVLVYDAIRFLGTLTAARTVTMSRERFSRPTIVKNTAGQSLTFTTPAGAGGDTLANNETGTLVYDLSADYVRKF